jgi:hypothetical protein
MMRQLEMLPDGSRHIVPDTAPACLEEIIPSSNGVLPATLAEQLASVAERVRSRVKSMSCDIIGIGYELLAVKDRIPHGRFLDWVEAECNLSRRHAQLVMRAAQWAQGKNEIVSLLEPTALYALAAPSTPETVRQEVLSDLENGHTPAPKAVKRMIRAAKVREPTAREKNGEAELVAQCDGRRHAQPECGQTEPGQPETIPLETVEAKTEPLEAEAPLTEKLGLQHVPPQRVDHSYPDVDPFKQDDPLWINGAIQLIPLLIAAIPLETIPNRNMITRGAPQLIPPLVEAVLELQDIPKLPSITGLLKYCAYTAYAKRVAQHSGRAMTIAAVAGPELTEAGDVA